MSLSKIKTLALILTVAVAASAQFNVPVNARKHAIAGAPMSDISGIYKYPALMTGFTNHAQASWNGGNGVFGIAAVNDMISVGILANQGLMAPYFADAAIGAANGFIPGAAPGSPANFNEQFNIPHFLLGFDLGAVALGFDIFFEYASFTANSNSPTGNLDYKAHIMHPGAKLGLKLNAGEVGILAKAGIGFPSIGGEVPPAGTPRLSMESGLYMDLGAEARIPLGGIDLIPGAEYTHSAHRFTGSTVTGIHSLFSVFFGVEFNIAETVATALQYNFVREGITEKQDATGDPSRTSADNIHIFKLGIENSWEDAWIFDAFFLRGGAQYAVVSEVGNTHNIPADTDTRYSRPAQHGRVSPVLGLGVSRDFFTLDVSLNMGSWSGLISGPGVAVVTGTVKF